MIKTDVYEIRYEVDVMGVKIKRGIEIELPATMRQEEVVAVLQTKLHEYLKFSFTKLT
jgi:hypothetical protein